MEARTVTIEEFQAAHDALLEKVKRELVVCETSRPVFKLEDRRRAAQRLMQRLECTWLLAAQLGLRLQVPDWLIEQTPWRERQTTTHGPSSSGASESSPLTSVTKEPEPWGAPPPK